jgi:hypothetical protein
MPTHYIVEQITQAGAAIAPMPFRRNALCHGKAQRMGVTFYIVSPSYFGRNANSEIRDREVNVTATGEPLDMYATNVFGRMILNIRKNFSNAVLNFCQRVDAATQATGDPWYCLIQPRV